MKESFDRCGVRCTGKQHKTRKVYDIAHALK